MINSDPHTITLDELRALPDCVMGAAVYFLWDGDKLLYVGGSRADASERVARHARSRDFRNVNYTPPVPFKDCTMFKCSKNDVWDFEQIFLNRFTPPYNQTLEARGC